MTRVLSAALLAGALSMVFSSTLHAADHRDGPGRSAGCSASHSTSQPTTVARPGHTVQPANATTPR